MLGEGVAVWVAGQYGGLPLEQWKLRLPQPAPPVTSLFGRAFRQVPEAQSYPLAGLFVAAAVGRVGLGPLRDHLYPASAATWDDACHRAGTTP